MTAACKKTAALFSAALICFSFSSCSEKNASSESFVFDTYASLSVNGKNAEDTLSKLNSAFDTMNSAFGMCYDTDADKLPDDGIYRDCFEKTASLRNIYGENVNVSCGALTDLWGISSGSPRVPSEDEINAALKKTNCESFGDFPEGARLDFGAVSKGYACDRAYELLKESETSSAVISLSSSALFYGEKPNGEYFRTGVTDPLTGEGLMGIISAPASFISTSGGYERYFEADGEKYSHIFDIKTGYPVKTDIVSVTVIVPADTPGGGIMSDFLATLIYTDGSENLSKWLSYDDFQVIAVTENGAVHTNSEFFSLDENSAFYYG